MPTCPHCGQPVRPGHALCPFCGTNLATGETPQRPPAKSEEVTTGMGVGCGIFLLLFVFFFAIAAAEHEVWDMQHSHGASHPSPLLPVIFWLPYAVPVTVIVVLAVALRRRAPMFVRGLLISLAIAVALWLGALVFCR